MEFNELYNTLRYTIECRKCGGGGGSGRVGGDPCGVCLGSGVEGVSGAEKIVEDRVLASYRFLVINGLEIQELEV
ncbi:hypothetical protein LCGC14_1484370 [marine sediment metagenome]|uniref:Uncharacterized protein n=1 Tax=marine sediment metagenome TaxID=412755 RepID=A0A0F9J8J0_9ZZZZ|nr:hypothetical protein [Desulfobacterales bacterium]